MKIKEPEKEGTKAFVQEENSFERRVKLRHRKQKMSFWQGDSMDGIHNRYP